MMDLSAEDLTGRPLYDVIHARDLQMLRKAHIDLLEKGQVLTDYYRLLNTHGGYVWIQTCATVICNNKNTEEQNMIAINYVLSGIECANSTMDLKQYRKRMGETITDMDTFDFDKRSAKEFSSPLNCSLEKNQHDRKLNMLNTYTTNGSVSSESLNNREVTDLQRNKRKLEMCDVTNDGPMAALRLAYTLSGPLEPEAEEIEDSSSYDSKLKLNSRRKTHAPRKRERTNEDKTPEQSINLHPESNSASTPVATEPTDKNNLEDSHKNGDIATSIEFANNKTPSSPQIMNNITALESPTQASRATVAVTTSSHNSENNNNIDKWNSASTDNTGTTQFQYRTSTEQPPKSAPLTGTSRTDSTTSSSSVKHLEEAMNKHLPSDNSHHYSSIDSSVNSAETSASSEYLDFYRHRSTIQWVGSQPPSTDIANPSSQCSPVNGRLGPPVDSAVDQLSASNLLRSLYANRESVIRSSVVYAPPRSHYYATSVNDVSQNSSPSAAHETEPSVSSANQCALAGGMSAELYQSKQCPAGSLPGYAPLGSVGVGGNYGVELPAISGGNQSPHGYGEAISASCTPVLSGNVVNGASLGVPLNTTDVNHFRHYGFEAGSGAFKPAVYAPFTAHSTTHVPNPSYYDRTQYGTGYYQQNSSFSSVYGTNNAQYR